MSTLDRHGRWEGEIVPDWRLNDHQIGQQESHVGTDFYLNQVYVDDVGPEHARTLCQILRNVGTRMAHRRHEDVLAALADELGRAQITITPTQLSIFADQICRSDWIEAH